MVKKAWFILITLFLIVGCSNKNLKVASLNITTDSETKESMNKLVTEVINSDKVDIMGLQGIDSSSLQKLNQDSEKYSFITHKKINISRRGQIPILYNPVKVRNLSKGVFWLSNTPEIPGSRSWNAGHPAPVLWSKFETIPSNKEFYVFNAHFDSVSDSARKKSAYLLLKQATQITKGASFIILGSFYFSENMSVFQSLTGEWQDMAVLSSVDAGEKQKSAENKIYNQENISEIDKDSHIFVPSNIEAKGLNLLEEKERKENKNISRLYEGTKIQIKSSSYNYGKEKELPLNIFPPYIDPADSIDYFFQEDNEIQLKCYFDDAQIFYTLDGSQPNRKSKVYNEPIKIQQTTRIKARSYRQGAGSKEIMNKNFYKVDSARLLEEEQLIFNNYILPQYFSKGKRSLIDRKRGKKYNLDRNWIGFRNNFDIVIEFEETSKSDKLMIGFLQDKAVGCYLPESVTIYHSRNSVQYDKYASRNIEIMDKRTGRYDFTLDLDSLQTRYIRIVADKNESQSDSKYIFVDEMIFW